MCRVRHWRNEPSKVRLGVLIPGKGRACTACCSQRRGPPFIGQLQVLVVSPQREETEWPVSPWLSGLRAGQSLWNSKYQAAATKIEVYPKCLPREHMGLWDTQEFNTVLFALVL